MKTAQDVTTKHPPLEKRTSLAGWVGAMGIGALSVVAVTCMHASPAITVHANWSTPFTMQRISDVATVRLSDGGLLSLRHGVLERAGMSSPLLERRHFASLTVMPTGQVLVWGGVDDQGHLVETGEWFEPSTGALVTTGRLGLPVRAAHTLNVLPDGTLAMTGGWEKGNRPAGDVAIWRPLDRQLELRRGEVGKPRFGAEATLMADGSLTIAGGVDEIGRPRHDSWTLAGSPEAGRLSAHGLVDSWPRKDRTDVSPIGPLSLRFAESVDVRQLAGSVSLLGPNGMVAVRVVGVEDGKLAFVQLPDELYPSARYTLFVKGLHTARGEDVPYEAIGFTTRAAGDGVVQVGEGTRSPDKAAKQDEPPLYVMAGAGAATPCKPADAFHLCRDKGEVRDGAFYPGQDNVATASGGHWRLYRDKATLPDTRKREADLGKGATALIGQVRRIDESPVANVEISVDGQQVRTDADGVFVLPNLVAGRKELFVDGRPAGRPGTEYGRFVVGADVAANTINHMSFVMYLPRVLARDKIALPSPTTRETVLTHPDMPGLELRIPAGAVFRDREGKVLDEIAIVPTPVDHAPFPLPDNFPMYFTIQPGDAVVQGMTPEAAKGLQIVYPNYGKQKPAERADFWVYSADKGWQMYGAGHVSADASQLVADNDTRLVWALGAGASTNPPEPDNDKKPNNKQCGDPVDLQTGRMFENWVDLRVNDVMPVAIDRSISGLPNITSPFGLGSGTNLAMKLTSLQDFKTPQIVLSCGEAIRFDLVAGRSEWPLVGTVWKHTKTNSAFYGATLQFLNDTTPEGAHWVITLTDGSAYWFERHAPNRLVRRYDPFGNKIELAYESGLLSSITSPNGRSIGVHFNSKNVIDYVADSSGRKVSYQYHAMKTVGDLRGLLLDTVVYPDGTSEKYEYQFTGDGQADGESWFIKTITGRDGKRKLLNEFGINNTIIRQTFADGSALNFTYEKTNGVTLATNVTDQNGVVDRTEFDPVSLYPIKETFGYGTPLAQMTTYVREASGLVQSETDTLGRKTTYQYNAAGRMTETVMLPGAPEEITTRYTYDGDNNLTKIADSLGRARTYTYDGRCLTSTTDAKGQVTTFSCSVDGQVTSITDPRGGVQRFEYRGGDLVARTEASGRVHRYVYDDSGRVIGEVGPSGSAYTKTYDANDRPVAYTYPDGASAKMQYDAVGNLVSVTLPNGGVRTNQYDVMGRLVKRTAIDGKAEAWIYEKGRLMSYTDRKGQATSYSYDALGRRTLIAYADGQGVQTTYDPAGRVTELLDSASGALNWSYDNLNRVTQVSGAQGWVKYGYDKRSRRTSMSTSSGSSTSYGYDERDQVTSIAQDGEQVGMTYDARGNRTELTLPNGTRVHYDYDTGGDLRGIDYVNTAIGAQRLSLSNNADGPSTRRREACRRVWCRRRRHRTLSSIRPIGRRRPMGLRSLTTRTGTLRPMG